MGTIKKWKLVKVAVLEKWMPLTALQRACFNPKRAHHQMFRLQATALLFIVKSCYQKRWRGKSDICHSHFYILFFFKTLFPWKGKTSNEPLTCWAHRLPSVNELTSTVTLLPAYVSGPQIVPPPCWNKWFPSDSPSLCPDMFWQILRREAGSLPSVRAAPSFSTREKGLHNSLDPLPLLLHNQDYKLLMCGRAVLFTLTI